MNLSHPSLDANLRVKLPERGNDDEEIEMDDSDHVKKEGIAVMPTKICDNVQQQKATLAALEDLEKGGKNQTGKPRLSKDGSSFVAVPDSLRCSIVDAWNEDGPVALVDIIKTSTTEKDSTETAHHYHHQQSTNIPTSVGTAFKESNSLPECASSSELKVIPDHSERNNNATSNIPDPECGIDNIEQHQADYPDEDTEEDTVNSMSNRGVLFAGTDPKCFERSASTKTFLCVDFTSERVDDGKIEEIPSRVTNSLHNQMKYHFRLWQKDLKSFKMLKILQVILAVVGGILTLSPAVGLRDTETGLIIDASSTERTDNGLILVNGVERAIVASTHFQVICIGITRMSAFFMYPALVMVYASKFRATTSFVLKSPLAMYMYKDSHELHVYCGWTILIFSVIHTVFHIARWAQQGNLYLLFKHFSGLTGVFIILSCLLICIPMTVFRTQICYEIRKKMHYLCMVFALALMFHTPTSAIPNGGYTGVIFGTIIIWYCMDALFCFFFMTEKIETTKFSVMDSGVRMTMDVSKRFQKMGNQGGVVYVCLPWINKGQWHPFSLFESPSNPQERQIFIQKAGDWTTQVHRVLQRETVRPAWVQGPFPSPYDNAIAYDNQILVASGIGITPALSVIRAHKDTRRINLVWVVRDASLLEFFLNHLYLDHDGWNLIFYTGKKNIKDQCINLEHDTNVCIVSG